VNLVSAATYNVSGGATTVYECGEITETGTYTVNQSINSSLDDTTCITISANDVVLDGNSKKLDGNLSSTYGIYSENNVNITIKNFKDITNFSDTGIYLLEVNNSVITNNSINFVGISSNDAGIYLQSSFRNFISNNTLMKNKGYGIYLDTDSNNTIKNNTLSFNYVDGIYLQDSSNNTLEKNNLANNERYGIYLSSSLNNTVKNNTLIENEFGFYLESSNFNIILENNVSSNYDYGIEVYGGSNNTFMNNSLADNRNYGIYLSNTLNNSIQGNNFIENTYHGIYLTNSDLNIIKKNNLTLNSAEINLYSGSDYNYILNNYLNQVSEGIILDFSSDNTLQDNLIYSEGYNEGISLYSSSDNNQIINNSINNSESGIYIYSSSNNIIINGTVNNSRGNAIKISGAVSKNNNFTNITIVNTLSSAYDFSITSAGINGTYLINMQIRNYSLGASGGRVYFKDALFGEIQFSESINGSGTNLSNDIRILNNSLYVNSSSNNGLDRSANITLYGMSNRGFNFPVILKDNLLCTNCHNFTSLTADSVTFNVSSFSNYYIGSDIFPPIINMVYPINNTNHIDNLVDINYTISDNYLGYCWYTNNSGKNNYTITCGQNITNVNWNQGVNNISIYVNDSAGNRNVSYVTFWVDSIKPDIQIIYPLNNSNHSVNTIDINYTASDTNLQVCWYSNNTYRINMTLDNCANLTTIIWADGLYNITIWVNDSFGNINHSTVSLRIDTTPPYFINFADKKVQNGSELNYDINANDYGIGIESFSINWTNLFSINKSTGVLSNISELEVGIYYINVSVNDTLGNIDSSVLQVNVSNCDVTPPTLSNVFSSVTSSTATITWTTDEESNSSVYYGLITSTESSLGDAELTQAHSISLSGLSASTTYYYNVSSCDYWGNCNVSEQYSFTTSASSSNKKSSGGGSSSTSTNKIG